MDLMKKIETIIGNKIKFLDSDELIVKEYIVYLLHNDNIVHVGKTSSVLKYTKEKKESYKFSHYSFEEQEANEADNYLAQIVLEIKPIYNVKVPINTKYISHHAAKKQYFTSKPDFRKAFNEYGGYQFNSTLYMKKNIFNDAFAQLPYHENMPKVGRRVLLLKDYKDIRLNGDMILDTLYDKNGNPISALREYVSDFKEDYEKITSMEEKEYVVNNLLDSQTFEAIRESDRHKITLSASNLSSPFVQKNNQNSCCDDMWTNVIDECTVNGIKGHYLESIEKNKKC